MSLSIKRALRAFAQYATDAWHRERALHDESIVVYHIADVADGETTSLRITNPTTDRTADIVEVRRYAEFPGTFRMLDSFSDPPSGGTANGEDSLLMDTAEADPTTTMTVDTDPTYTADGDPHFAWPTETASDAGIARPGEGGATQPYLEPGRDLVFELEAETGSSGTAAVGVVYDELPYVPSETSVIPFPETRRE